MKKTMVKSNRKVFSGILSFIFTLSLFTLFLPLKATAATYPYDYNDDGFVYMVYSDHVVAVGFEPNTLDNFIAKSRFKEIKSYINNIPVTQIGSHALSQTPIKSIIIPKTVKRINGDEQSLFVMNGAFSQTDLETVTIPYNVEYIGKSAFNFCRNLRSIYIENPNCTIEDNQSVINNGTDIATYKSYFNGTIYGYPGSTAEAYATKYGYQFADIMTGDVIITSMTTTTVKRTTTTTTVKPTNTPTTTTTAIRNGNCGENLKYTLKDGTLTISGSGDMNRYNEYITMIRDDPSVQNTVNTVIINDGATSIGEYAFSEWSNLSSITIPNTVTYIGSNAFALCQNLKSITIPDSVTDIGFAAFRDCSNLTSIKGYSNSAAERYAKANGIAFENLGQNINTTTSTTVSSSTITMKCYTERAVDKHPKIW